MLGRGVSVVAAREHVVRVSLRGPLQDRTLAQGREALRHALAIDGVEQLTADANGIPQAFVVRSKSSGAVTPRYST